MSADLDRRDRWSHASRAERWGLVNADVPQQEVVAEAKRWAAEIASMSPTAIRFLKHSFNADADHQGGISNMADAGFDLFVEMPEGREGAMAFTEKRQPDFARFAR
jgi:1,4-dihydroxy-2-naphthoyl-CoA synthase